MKTIFIFAAFLIPFIFPKIVPAQETYDPATSALITTIVSLVCLVIGALIIYLEQAYVPLFEWWQYTLTGIAILLAIGLLQYWLSRMNLPWGFNSGIIIFWAIFGACMKLVYDSAQRKKEV